MLATLREIDPAIMAIQVKTMSRHLATMLLPARLGAIAFTLFAGLAIGLALLGVYGVVSYAVARRTREVGIRLAIGAQPGALVRLLMREGITLVATGTVLGVLLGLGGFTGAEDASLRRRLGGSAHVHRRTTAPHRRRCARGISPGASGRASRSGAGAAERVRDPF